MMVSCFRSLSYDAILREALIVTWCFRGSCGQNDDEDLIFMYDVYLHKLITSFLSQSLGHGKVRCLYSQIQVRIFFSLHFDIIVCFLLATLLAFN